MAVSIVSSSGVPQYGVYHYIVDNESDREKIRTTDRMGSTVYVIKTNKRYILDSNHEWQIMKNNSGSGSGEDDFEVAEEPEIDEMLNDIFN